MENKKWISLCIVGGILMIIGTVAGSVGFFETVFQIASQFLEEQFGLGEVSAAIFEFILVIFNYIAMGGGISVIVGALIVALGSYGAGKFIIGLGAGMGLISLIIFLVTGIIEGALIGFFTELIVCLIGLNGGFGFTGVLLTILSRRKMKKEE